MKSPSGIISDIIEWFYFEPFRRIFSPTVFRYGACGAFNMALDTLWYWAVFHFVVAKQNVDLGFAVVSPHIMSLFIVFPITFFIGFWLNRTVAFRSTSLSSLPQIGKYALTVVGSILLNYALMKLFVDAMGLWPTPSKMITTLVCVVYSYLVGRYYTFTAAPGKESVKE